jgi:uncharacterized membrane protein YkvA (DUF1232 family)
VATATGAAGDRALRGRLPIRDGAGIRVSRTQKAPTQMRDSKEPKTGKQEGEQESHGAEVIGPEIRIGELLEALPSFAKLIYRLIRDPRVPFRRKVVLGLVTAYLFVPVDLVPDFVPGLGQVDDLLLVIWALERFVIDTPDEVLYDLWDGNPSLLGRVLHVLRYSPKDLRRIVKPGLRSRMTLLVM